MIGRNLSSYLPCSSSHAVGRALVVLDAWRGGPSNAAGGRGLENTRMSQREVVLFLFGAAVLTAAAGAGVIVNVLRLF